MNEISGTVSNDWFDEEFASCPVMAILRGMGAERSLSLATLAWDQGIDAVELPVQSPADLAALRVVCAAGAERGKHVGAGTVVSVDQLDDVVGAGAAYIVSPGFDAELVRAADSRGLPSLPGVATPSEVQAATALGLSWVKAFPAAWLGASWFRLIRAPFPRVSFVATGGIDASNLVSFLDAGARVAAVGSALEDPGQLPRIAELIAERSSTARQPAAG